MEVSSETSEEHYAWLAHFPQIREWIGNRVVHNLTAYGFTLKNRKFESTISVNRPDIEDDRIGVFAPILAEMGRNAAAHPDLLVFDLMANGFTELAYDGQYFFDTDHPVTDATGAEQAVSNMQAGGGNPWFLLDTSRMIKPFVFQRRIPYTFQQRTQESDENVFMADEFMYGTRARVNAGYGLWQLAFGSKDTLDDTNYASARQAMMAFTGDNGVKLGIRPDTLVCGPSNESAALKILNAATGDAGASNVWYQTAKLIVTPYLA